MRRVCLHRQQAAGHLVLALGAALEALVALGDAPGQRLVVAGLEVQAGHMLDRAPVAPVGHPQLRLQRDQGTGHTLLTAPGGEQQPVLRHGVGHGLEEAAFEVGRGVVGPVGEGVAAVEEVPVVGADLAPLGGAEVQAGLEHAAALLLDLLAFFTLQTGQEVSEIDKGLGLPVGPVELHRAAHHPAAALCGQGTQAVGLVDEQGVHR